MFKSKKAYIEYEGNIINSFSNYIDKPPLFETNDGFSGRLTGNRFWFYKRYPMIRNSFRTVLYGEIIDNHRICYRYGKIKGVIPFVLFVDIVFLMLFIILMVSHFQRGGKFPPIQMWFPIIISGIVSGLTFYYPQKEKDLLYSQLQKICGNNSREIC